MRNKKKIFIICGEESGDIIGAALINAIRAKTQAEVEFCGVGGDRMIAEGLNPIFHMREISTMGLSEVITKIPKIIGRIRKTISAIVDYDPDVVIAIDAQEFSKFILKRVKTCKRVLYVAPSIWAWRPWRAKTLKHYVDKLLVLYKFEEDFFSCYGVDVEYVGHPLLENKCLLDVRAERFLERHNIKEKVLLVLPGSRENEIKRLLPIFLQAARKAALRYRTKTVIPCNEKDRELICKILLDNKCDALVVTEDKYDAFKAASVAIAASGTVALELALTGTKTVICYKVSKLTEYLLRFLLNTRFISIPNIIMDEGIMPELLQEDCNVDRISCEVDNLINSRSAVEEKLRDFRTSILEGVRDTSPSNKAAEIVLRLIGDL